MAEQLASLRTQVAAAEFLLRSLQAQLREAEERFAQDQQQQRTQIEDVGRAPQNSTATVSAGLRNDSTVADGLTPPFGLLGEPVAGEVLIGNADGQQHISHTADGEDAGTRDVIESDQQVFELPSLEVGITYPSLEDVKRAAIAHAISQGWTCGVDKRDRTRLMLKCRSAPGCPFHLRAEQYENGARIASYKAQHSCVFQPDQSHVPRANAASMKFLREQLPTFMDLDETTTAKAISDGIYKRFGTRVSMKQCRDLRIGPRRKRSSHQGTCTRCGAIGHNRKTCGRTTE